MEIMSEHHVHELHPMLTFRWYVTGVCEVLAIDSTSRGWVAEVPTFTRSVGLKQ